MLNIKTNINGKQRIFSSNIKNDRVKKAWRDSQRTYNGGVKQNPTLMKFSREFEKKNDSIMSIDSEETHHKPVISELNFKL
jgi:hypothetical protein